MLTLYSRNKFFCRGKNFYNNSSINCIYFRLSAIRERIFMINIILWIVFGALAGWIASMITKTNEQQGALGNIITGIVGAFLGGYLVKVLTGNEVEGFNLGSLLVAILGAVILISILKLLRRGKRAA